MIWNPVYKMEKMTSSRSLKMAVLVFGMNLILTVAAFVMLYSIIHEARYTGEMPYQSFIQLYRLVAYFEFALILLIVPALTAGAISGEREHQTLDLLLSTRMNCWDIIIGKLCAAFRIVLIVILSGFPVLSLIFVYGGISGYDMILLFVYYVGAALFSGSLSIMISALFQKTSVSTALSYLIVVLLNVGTGAVVYLSYRFSYTKYLETPDFSFYPTAGHSVYLLLINPAVSFYAFISGQIGSGREFEYFLSGIGVNGKSFVLQNWVMVSVVLQVTASLLFIFLAVRKIDPMRRRLFS